MSDNLLIKDGNRNTQYVKTTYDSANNVHTPHHIVETAQGSPLEVTLAGSGNGAINVTASIQNPVPVKIGNLTGDALDVNIKSIEQNLKLKIDDTSAIKVKNELNGTIDVSIKGIDSAVNLTTKYLAPTKITKKLFSNVQKAGNSPNISWDLARKGTFSIAAPDPERKNLNIYNNSNYILYISLSEHQNSSLVVDFDNLADLNNCEIIYKVKDSNGSDIELFNYSLIDLLNPYVGYTVSSVLLGNNINCAVSSDGNLTKLKVFFDTDYNTTTLNTTNSEDIGKLVVKIGSNEQEFILDKTLANKNFNAYAEYSSNTFSNDSLILFDKSSLINGFLLESDLSKAPIEFSYVLYPGEGMLISEADAGIGYNGYFANTPNIGEIVVNVTEGR